MNKPNFTARQLLQELARQIKTKEIGFWIENQDCYLWENACHYTNKVKVGDLSQTQEAWWAEWLTSLEKTGEESEIQRQTRAKQFREISDVALIRELEKRIQNQTIKLSMYSNHKHIHIEAKDIDAETSLPLPLEIKENNP